jgi:hypothetical protein
MDGTTSASFFTKFTSPWRHLAWSFRKSRDNWKKKYQKLKREHKRLQNQVHDVRKSREHWRSLAEQTQAQGQALKEASARLQAESTVFQAADEKKGARAAVP